MDKVDNMSCLGHVVRDSSQVGGNVGQMVATPEGKLVLREARELHNCISVYSHVIMTSVPHIEDMHLNMKPYDYLKLKTI